MRILVLSGPNLQLLGTREPQRYGSLTLDAIHARLQALGLELAVDVDVGQSNHEGVLVDRIAAASGVYAGIVLNAGAYTHTSIALRDALLAVAIPFVEVHLSNVAARESFRQHSYLSDIAAGVVFGFGAESYSIGLRGLVEKLKG
ncbi:MAG: type II 3-dehydroquinate dehydratase [Myxococcales bacterium]|nr:type II 3-dehydroquinate dehydratase [Myxococcales bacterium]